jgi:TRAP-type mannitol/chloroaromatic compound transport system permease small subunit
VHAQRRGASLPKAAPFRREVESANSARGLPDRQLFRGINTLGRIERLADRIDALTDHVGRWASWLVLAVIALLFGQLPLRELAGGGHILANDFGQVVHAGVFMFGLSYALRWDRHVRMDVFYRRMAPRTRALVNALGTVFFLLPWCGLMLWFGTTYMIRAVAVLERFPDTFSPGYFVFKVLLVVCLGLLALQGIGMLMRNAILLFAGPTRPEAP